VVLQALASTQVFASDHQELLKATIKLDFEYISALFYTSQGDFVASEQAMQDLQAQWQQFSSVYDSLDIDPQWQHFVAAANRMIQTADEYVVSGKLMKAHEELEGVRVTLQGLRERNGIDDYFLDQLHGYHVHMNAIFQAGKGKTAAQMTEGDVKTIQKHWAEVWPRWEKIRHHVSRAKFDQALYNFSDDRLIELKQAISEEQVALYQLKLALLNGDRDRIARAAEGLPAGFMRTYRAFGDIPYD
jgi:hypothetical protein